VNGISGEQTDSMAPRFKRDLAALLQSGSRPAIIIVLGGTNDLGSFATSTTISNLNEMWSEARACGAKLVCCTLPDGGIKEKRYNEDKTVVNAAIRDYAEQNSSSGVMFVDLFKAIPWTADKTDPNFAFWEVDWVHFNARGYDRMGEIIFDAVKSSL